MSTLDFVLHLIWIWLAADVAVVALLMLVQGARHHSRNSPALASLEFERKYREDKAELFAIGLRRSQRAARGGV
jgi:hypothetical protein